MNTQTKLFGGAAVCGAFIALPVPWWARAALFVVAIVLNGMGFWRYATHPHEGRSF